MQQSLIQQRLIYLFREKFGGRSIRSLVEDIVLSEATEYDPDRIGDGRKYDAELSIKDANIRNLVGKRIKRAGKIDFSQIEKYLCENKYLLSKEVEALNYSKFDNFPARISSGSNIKAKAIQVRDGEYIFERFSDAAHEFGFLVLSVSHGKSSAQAKRVHYLYMRRDNEDPVTFKTRLQTGSSDKNVRFDGGVFPHTERAHILIECCGELSLKTSSISSDENSANIIIFENFSTEHIFIDFSNVKNFTFWKKFRIIENNSDFLFSKKEYKYKKKFYPKAIFMSENQDLIEAAKNDDPEAIVSALLNGADINFRDKEYGFTALHWAARNRSWLAFCVLSGEEGKLEEIVHDTLSNAAQETGEPASDTFERWREVAETLDPLIRDHSGYFPSQRFTGDVTGLCKVAQAERNLWEAFMSLELRTATARGQNYFSLLGQAGGPLLPDSPDHLEV